LYILYQMVMLPMTLGVP